MERIKKALELARQSRLQEQETRVQTVDSSAPRLADQQPVDIKGPKIQVSMEVLEYHRILSGLQDRALMAPYKMLRTQVLQRMQQSGWTTLAVTGPRENVGKTLTAVNLAVSLASSSNQAVFLVDLDLRRPSAHTVFGHQPEYGIAEHLMHSVPMEKVAFSPGVERLTVIPGTRPLEHSSELLSSPAMKQFVAQLKGRDANRLCIFDLPPVLMSDDVLAFSPLVDALLLVVEDGKTTREDLNRSLELIADLHLIGTVLNKSQDVIKSDYSYQAY
ncbi:MAG: CpsD/CapB family tyrosine-protein kinase [Gammaproteobacteria bacterium]|jgi:Mrp family chromosome partitioning ATPase